MMNNGLSILLGYQFMGCIHLIFKANLVLLINSLTAIRPVEETVLAFGNSLLGLSLRQDLLSMYW